MRKSTRFVFSLLLTCCMGAARAQTDQWTWIAGDNARDQTGVYGTLGTAAAGNKPGGRYNSNPMIDASGNMWLFGGYGFASTSVMGYLGDFWKYDMSTGLWTWMGGSNLTSPTSYGVYGTKGVAAAANIPGTRYDYASWSDGSNLWIFGGYAFAATGQQNVANDLWKYNIASGLWTWVSGSNTTNAVGVYGVVGATGTPGSRQSAAYWLDPVTKKMWLFGGYGNASTFGAGAMNDLWVFDPATSLWTFMGGNTTVGNGGVYGTQGVAAAGNQPGSRKSSAGGADASGNIWLFGGMGYVSTTQGYLNDLWKYTISTGTWTWISGDNVLNKFGVYGTRLVPAATNKPGGRYNNSGFIDASGNLLIFGGVGYVASGTPGSLSDMWEYNVTMQQWVYMNGNSTTNALAVYGTQGTGSPTTKPGGMRSSRGWVDASGNLLILAGQGNDGSGLGYLNNIFQFVPGALIILPVKLTSFTAHEQNKAIALSWTTAQEQNSWHFVIERSVDGINFDSIGVVRAAGMSALPINYTFADRKPGNGSNFYHLRQVDLDGQSNYSNVVKVDIATGAEAFRVLQNPVYSSLPVNVELPAAQTMSFRITDGAGRVMLQKRASLQKGSNDYTIDIRQLNPGTYFVSAGINGEMKTVRFIKL